MRGPAFFAYADNYLIDVKYGIIVDVEASRAIRQAEVGAAKTMIERTEARFNIKPERLAADTAYGSGPNLDWLVQDKDIAPHIPVIDKSKREDGTFSREDFRFDKERNVYICPANKTLTTTGTVIDEGETLRYLASTSDCRGCPLKMQCCPKAPFRIIPRSAYEEARDVARALAKTEAFEQSRQERKRLRCVCPSQAYPKAWSPSIARPAWRPVRVYASRYCTKPTPARQAGGPTAASRCCLWGIIVAGVGIEVSKSPLSMKGRQPAVQNQRAISAMPS